MWVLASMSPRSMRLASSTSWAAVSSGTRPIERRYSRSESRLGSTVRSICGRLALSPPSEAGFVRASASASMREPSLVAGFPSWPTISMPWSSRCWCSSRTCSLVTSTSSSVAAIAVKPIVPRSCASLMSALSSSSSQIGASSASSASAFVLISGIPLRPRSLLCLEKTRPGPPDRSYATGRD